MNSKRIVITAGMVGDYSGLSTLYIFPLKVRKIAVYCFLISFLVPELLRFKDLKNYQEIGTKNAWSWIKSSKINKIYDVM